MNTPLFLKGSRLLQNVVAITKAKPFVGLIYHKIYQSAIGFVFGLLLLLLTGVAALAQEVLVGLTFTGGADGGGTAFSMKTTGASFTVHRKFLSAGKDPYGDLVKGTDGNLYGMTYKGGNYDRGTIFKMTSSGSLTVLKHLDGTTTGSYPQGSLIQALDGNFYGMTMNGGTNNYGTIFKITPEGTLTILKSFDRSTTGRLPKGSLIQASDGNFYGMTYIGGTYDYGTIFKITSGGIYTVIKVLDGATTGGSPRGNLVQGSDGNFYGMTSKGGILGYGTIFKITSTGTLTVLKQLDNTTTGGNPTGSLLRAADNNLYGMTWGGGTSSYGTIFKITIAGTLTVLKHLDDAATGGNSLGGNLVQGGDGNLYGMTTSGGTNGYGTIFKCTPTGSFTVLRHLNNATDGGKPWGSLYKNSDGYFYGMTVRGGSTYNNGTIFKISATGTFSVLIRFPNNFNGFNPSNSLVQAKDGNYYGMAKNGGKYGFGNIYKLCTSGSFTSLHSFDGIIPGKYPEGNLIQGSDGNFYGMTTNNNTYDDGTIFKMTPSGTVTVLKHLDNDLTGSIPYGSLLQGKDGNFYGMTKFGGTAGLGTLFKITPSGTLTVLYNFGASGAGFPMGGLIQATDGNFYGMTYVGGGYGDGNIFKITPSGTLTVLKVLQGSTTGGHPQGSLIQGKDGNFYGICYDGGTYDYGTIFKITPGGTFTVLKILDGSTTGGAPERNNLVQGSDGTLYGMTKWGGTYNGGTIFKITTAGAFTVLRHLNPATDGGNPYGSLVIQKPNPVANLQTVSTLQNKIKKIKLTGSGGSPLIYAIATAPKKGTATITKDTLYYTPNTGYVGADSIYFTASWGCQKSTPTKVKITVAATITIANTEATGTIISYQEPNTENRQLTVSAFPNPTATYFTLIIQSSKEQPLTLRILDVVGRVIEVRNSGSSSRNIRLGESYQNGFYYAEIIQGRKIVTLKLVKNSP